MFGSVSHVSSGLILSVLGKCLSVLSMTKNKSMKLLNQGHPGNQDQNLKPDSSSVIHLCSLMPPWLWGYPGLYWVLVLFTFRLEGTAILALDFMVRLCRWVARLCPPPIAALPMRCRCRSASSTTLCQDGGHALFIVYLWYWWQPQLTGGRESVSLVPVLCLDRLPFPLMLHYLRSSFFSSSSLVYWFLTVRPPLPPLSPTQ